MAVLWSLPWVVSGLESRMGWLLTLKVMVGKNCDCAWRPFSFGSSWACSNNYFRCHSFLNSHLFSLSVSLPLSPSFSKISWFCRRNNTWIEILLRFCVDSSSGRVKSLNWDIWLRICVLILNSKCGICRISLCFLSWLILRQDLFSYYF